MRAYETIFVLNPELGTDACAEQVEFYKDIITKNGGQIDNIDNWGKLNLAYQINRFREGIYTVIQFQAEGEAIAELERRYKYNEDVLRYIVVQLDEKRFKAKPRKDPVRKERRPSRHDAEQNADEAVEAKEFAEETADITEE